MITLLSARGISKRFGGLQALEDVSLTIHRGEVFGLIGPNGAGKTTFFNVLTGAYAPDQGEFVFNGTPLPSGSPHDIVACGIARTFQNIRLFHGMTALENVMTGHLIRSERGLLASLWDIVTGNARHQATEQRMAERAYELLRYVGIAQHANHHAGSLSYGDQRRLEIARALATEPQLLALDEPAAGMNAAETAQLSELIATLRADGITVMLIEHDVKLVMSLCDRVAVLDFGRKIAEDVPHVVRHDPRVIESWLGSAAHSG